MPRRKPIAKKQPMDNEYICFNKFDWDDVTIPRETLKVFALLNTLKKGGAVGFYMGLLDYHKDHANLAGDHLPVSKIMKIMNCSDKTVTKYTNILIEFGLFKRTRNKGKNQKRYNISYIKKRPNPKYLIKKLESEEYEEYPNTVKNTILLILKGSQAWANEDFQLYQQHRKKYDHVYNNPKGLLLLNTLGGNIASQRGMKKKNTTKRNKRYSTVKKNNKNEFERLLKTKGWFNQNSSIPKDYIIQIKRLHTHLRKLSPYNPKYKSLSPDKISIVKQANTLLSLQRDEGYTWEQIVEVLKFQRSDPYWSAIRTRNNNKPCANIQSYEGLNKHTTTGNGTKFEMMFNQVFSEEQKTPTKKFNPKTLFKTKWDLDNFNKLLPKIDVDTSNGELKLLAENIMSFHKFYDSLPKHTKDNGGCYNSPWELAEHYIDTVTKRFDSKPSYKILTSKHKMFKKYIYEDSRKLISADTNIGVDEDGNYIYRSTQ